MQHKLPGCAAGVGVLREWWCSSFGLQCECGGLGRLVGVARAELPEDLQGHVAGGFFVTCHWGAVARAFRGLPWSTFYPLMPRVPRSARHGRLRARVRPRRARASLGRDVVRESTCVVCKRYGGKPGPLRFTPGPPVPSSSYCRARTAAPQWVTVALTWVTDTVHSTPTTISPRAPGPCQTRL